MNFPGSSLIIISFRGKEKEMDVIVRVNGQSVTGETLEKVAARYLEQLSEDPESDFQLTPENRKYVRAEALNALIERVLLLQLAAQQGLSVDPLEVQERKALLRKEFDSESEWKRNLEALSIREEELDAELESDLLLEKFLDRLYENHIQITPESLEAYYRDNEERMKEPDLFSFYEVVASTPERVKIAATLLASGADKGEMEKELSQMGMELGHYADLPAPRIPPEILNVLADLEEGKLGTYLAEEGRIFVFRVLKRVRGRKLPFDQIKESLARSLIESGKRDAYSRTVSEALEGADIEYVNLDLLRKE